MNKKTLRLRMFAGPNGSGKSTFKSIIRPELRGHSVPEDKIVSRYQRSVDLLIEAIQFTNRAYIFDNSTHEYIWLAEITDGHLLEMKTDQVPVWFNKALGSKFNIGNKSHVESE